MRRSVIALALNLSIFSCMELNIVKEFFTLKDVSVYTAFVCTNDAFSLGKSLLSSSSAIVSISILEKSRPEMVPEHYVQGGYVDLGCPESVDFLDRMETFNTSFSWLINLPYGWNISVLTRVKFNLESDVTFAVCSENGGCAFHDLYKVTPNHPLVHYQIGNSSRNELILERKRYRNFLSGVTLRGGLYMTQIDIDWNEDLSKQMNDRTFHPELDIFNRYHFVLHEHLQQLYGYKLNITKSENFGYPIGDGHYSGLIGDIADGRIDFGIGPCEPREGRAELVDFLHPLKYLNIAFVFRQPKAFGTFGALAAPMSRSVWFLIFLLCLLFSFGYVLISSTSIYILRQLKRRDLSEGIVLVIGAFAQQGLMTSPKRLSERVFSFFLLLLATIVYAYYNAAIMNGLLRPAPSTIRNVDQLLETPHMEHGFLHVAYLTDNRSAYLYVKPYILEKVQKTKNYVMEIIPGIKRIQTSRFAFCGERVTLYSAIEKVFNDGEMCELSSVDLRDPIALSIPIAKNSPFRELLSQGFIRLLENGLSSRETKVWYTPFPQCLGSVSFYKVTLEAVGIALSVYCFGFVSSVLIFTFEIFICKLIDSNHTK